MSNTTPPSGCPNCGQPLATDPRPNFCPHCGQETHLHPPTLWEFVHEFAGHYMALEGALWRTLGALLLRPGRLTSEYLDGRRRRYVLPLRLYLSASFLFFALIKVMGIGPDVQVQVIGAGADTNRPASAVVVGEAHDEARLRACAAAGGAADACQLWERWLGRVVVNGEKAAQAPQAFLRQMIGVAPYAVFLLLPAFAALVMLAVRGRRLPYGAHFVFSLHMHSFVYLALLVTALLPEAAFKPMVAATALYGVWALRQVYGLRWPGAWMRGLGIGLVYGVLLVLVASAILLTVLASG